jgi:hypothetical protein
MRRILSITGRLRAITPTSSDRWSTFSESGSFPELAASGSFQRLPRPTEGAPTAKTRTQELREEALSELSAELESPTKSGRTPIALVREEIARRARQEGETPPSGTTSKDEDADADAEAKAGWSKPSSSGSRYLPPPTRTYTRPKIERKELPDPVPDTPSGKRRRSSSRFLPPPTNAHKRPELEEEEDALAESAEEVEPVAAASEPEPASGSEPEPESKSEPAAESESESESEPESETESAAREAV